MPPRLRTLPARIQALNTLARVSNNNVRASRITGRALQQRRHNVWLRNPHCAKCGRLVAMHEFELDHIVALHQGGEDVESNCQVLCAGNDGCHAQKTRADAAGH